MNSLARNNNGVEPGF